MCSANMSSKLENMGLWVWREVGGMSGAALVKTTYGLNFRRSMHIKLLGVNPTGKPFRFVSLRFVRAVWLPDSTFPFRGTEHPPFSLV